MNNWQAWIERNWQHIEYWARRWHYNEWQELIQHFALYLEKNWSKFSQIPDGEERIKFMQSWYKNNVMWKNSEFNKTIATGGGELEFPDILDRSDIEEWSEFESADIIRLKIDLANDFDQSQIEKILCIKMAYKQLHPTKQILFDFYFTKMMSLRKIAEVIGIPMSSVYIMINELKNELKERC